MGLKKLDSEYKSHYKSIPVHRPVTVKATVLSQPSHTAPEALESSRRAGLLSNQFSNVSEPPLQRKRIVPYKHNHNIFETRTVKEIDDGKWLDVVGSDDEPRILCTPTKTKNNGRKVPPKKKQTEYTSHFLNGRSEEDSPIIAANKTRQKKRSQDKECKDFIKRSNDHSPDRLPPAGIPTYISDPRDKRLLRPSDSSAYLTFPDQHPRKPETEYTERYESAAPKAKQKPVSSETKETSVIDEATYRKVLLHRSDAYGIPVSPVKHVETSLGTPGHRRRTDKESKKTHPRNEKVNKAKSESSASSVYSDRHFTNTDRRKKPKHTTKERPVVDRDQTNVVKHTIHRSSSVDGHSVTSSRSGRSKESSRKMDREHAEHSLGNVRKTNSGLRQTRRSRRRDWEEKKATSDHGRDTDSFRSIPLVKGTREELVERGRSPTPEMRHVGQSRRHHLDVTTGSNNPLGASIDYKTRILSKMADLDVRPKPREEYDPSRYSDAGDSFSCSQSTISGSDRNSVDTRSMTATSRSSKRSI